MKNRVKTSQDALNLLKESKIEYHQLQTEEAVVLYNQFSEKNKLVGGLFHATC